jgi:hypothetical protein
MNDPASPLFLVCEDGREYSERFERFLGRDFRFLRAGSFREADLALTAHAPIGVLLDLDFRRSPAADLLDESGAPASAPSSEQRARWSATQGILILQHLRGRGVRLPALLFADLDDAGQVSYLEQSLAPLVVVASREGLGQLAARLRAMAAAPETTADAG